MKYLIYCGLALSLVSCNGNKKTSEKDTMMMDSTSIKDSSMKTSMDKMADTPDMMDMGMMEKDILGKMVSEKGGISIYEFNNKNEFPDAMLMMNKPDSKMPADKDNKVMFRFGVKNYELGMQTPNKSAAECCNNSNKGQHIHLILNDKPYKPLYTTDFDTTLLPGHYVALAFVSSSYHESIKGKDAYKLSQFNVGAAKGTDADLKAPHLFYSRPKGTYKGKDTKNILLDFYLVNTELSANGNKVMATINGNEFTLDRWDGYIIKGLPMGKSTIKLKLVDKSGKMIAGPYNEVSREITLE